MDAVIFTLQCFIGLILHRDRAFPACLILRTFINSYNLQRMMASALYSFVRRVCDCYCIWVAWHGLFILNICLPLGCPKSAIATTSSRITVPRRLSRTQLFGREKRTVRNVCIKTTCKNSLVLLRSYMIQEYSWF